MSLSETGTVFMGRARAVTANRAVVRMTAMLVTCGKFVPTECEGVVC